MPCTKHRVFLATLIVAAKYLNDSSPKNKHWTKYAALFPLAEVTLMEKQLLYLLNFDLRISEVELLFHFKPFLPKTSSPIPQRSYSNPNVTPTSFRNRLNVPLLSPSTPHSIQSGSSDSCPSSISSIRSSPGPLTPTTPAPVFLQDKKSSLRSANSMINLKVNMAQSQSLSGYRRKVYEAADRLGEITFSR